jgi:hypothetical protein
MGALIDDISRVIASPVSRRQAFKLVTGSVGGAPSWPLWALAGLPVPRERRITRVESTASSAMGAAIPRALSAVALSANGRDRRPALAVYQ